MPELALGDAWWPTRIVFLLFASSTITISVHDAYPVPNDKKRWLRWPNHHHPGISRNFRTLDDYTAHHSPHTQPTQHTHNFSSIHPILYLSGTATTPTYYVSVFIFIVLHYTRALQPGKMSGIKLPNLHEIYILLIGAAFETVACNIYCICCVCLKLRAFVGIFGCLVIYIRIGERQENRKKNLTWNNKHEIVANSGFIWISSRAMRLFIYLWLELFFPAPMRIMQQTYTL